MMFEKKAVIYLLAVIEAVIWGFSFVGTKVALESLAPIEVIAMRWTLGALILVIFAMTGVIKTSFRGKNLKPVLILALIQPCIYSTCEVWGINLSTSSESALIIAIAPILVLLISSIVNKTKVSKSSIFAIFLAFGGVICTTIFAPNFTASGKYLGYFLVFLAALAGAVFTVASGKVGETFSSMEITICMAIEGAICFNIISLLQGNGLAAYKITYTNLDVLAAILFLGIGCTVIAYMIYNYVISKLPAHQAATLQVNLITLVGVISGVTMQGDPFGWYTVVGMVMILAGVIITNMYSSDSRDK